MEKLIVKHMTRKSGTWDIVYEDLEVRVGDGATICFYSDRMAVTVIEIGKNYVKVQEDESIRTDNNGMSDCQEYEYRRNGNGRIFEFKKTRKGTYTNNGKSKDFGYSLVFGFRRSYYDYTF